ncbi:3'(2'),5'-bisphosphate nucleotidase CysQ [Actinocorallia longicatena]|uniref:3'(2'),5-bisphosphonucleoside 3'(2')-phosphohydrolase n=1 Tax=Actinocorallia longicatena TaxID=111803 RepID=A0ABP6Q2Q2_9ACTN
MREDDHALAARLATEAGDLLLALRAERGFADGKALKDAGDLASHEFLMAALATARPDDAVLSEEGKDDKARLDASRVWIVDPLDGTREFSEEGRSDWAVHVALWSDGELIAGAVALPAQHRTLVTSPGGGAVIASSRAGATPGGTPTPAAATVAEAPGTVEATLAEPALAETPLVPADRDGVIRIVVSRTRPPQIVDDLKVKLEAAGHSVELVPLGSAGAKIAAVLLGDVDVYVHGGGQYEWDSAAPAAVALAAGFHASRLDGSPLNYNEDDPYLPDILVSHPLLAELVLSGLN